MKKKIKVALVGSPNSGKSSLFNTLTGLRQKVGNYPGVTVDKKTGLCKLTADLTAEVIDLPGTYSIYPKSADEQVTFDILNDPKNSLHPDQVVILADASNLKRSLLFASQIIDLKIPAVIALNMIDVAQRRGERIDLKKLSEEMGAPVMAINARKNEGIEALRDALKEQIPAVSKDFIDIRAFAPEVIEKIKENIQLRSNYAAFQVANQYESIHSFAPKEKEKVRKLLSEHHFQPERMQGEEVLKRYQKINDIILKTVSTDQGLTKETATAKIDKVLTHGIWGYLIFFFILFLMFQAIFSFAEYPMNWIDAGFSALSAFLYSVLPGGMFTNLLIEGAIAGIGGIVIFIPQIMLLFGFLTILEDTGYMARVSFLMDKLMQKMGLHGKSVVPLISGMACAIPAIMATRNIENRKSRLITILVTPLMSCSARLPVYTLLIALAVPGIYYGGVISLQGLIMLGLYLVGFVAAIGVAWFMKLFINFKEKNYFIMDMPVYRAPRWQNVFISMFERAKVFVVQAGKVILVISIILWFLASYGPSGEGPTGGGIAQVEDIEYSYAGYFGQAIEPVIRPLGFNWKIGIALITSFAAREVFVGTMATIYSINTDELDYSSLKEKMLRDIHTDTNTPVYTLATVFSLLIFYAFAMQCMSTLAVVYRETKSWKWPLIQLIYMTGLAYLSSFIVYQVMV